MNSDSKIYTSTQSISDKMNKQNNINVASKIAVLIPCYNEELTVSKVVTDFKKMIPYADIYVYDNNSKDRTIDEARNAGAIIRLENMQGKGFVIQRMFKEIDADIYIMVDGDNTYPADQVWNLINPIIEKNADMVVGSRLMNQSESEFKKLNRLGNNIFLWTINYFFNVKLTDILSGYRAFNRNFVKTLPLFGGGFETETELTIKSLVKRYKILEVPINLGVRPEGSNSKINIVRDGILISRMIFSLFRDYKPLTFFGFTGLTLMILGLVLGIVVVFEFIETGLVPRLPSAVLAVGLEIFGMLLLAVGLVLHTISRHSQELEHQVRNLFDELQKKD